MFSGNNVVPWHKCGTIVKGLLTAAEAIQAAHLDWQVEFKPVFGCGADGKFTEIDGYQRTYRADTGQTLGIMGGRYSIIQNSEAFKFNDVLVGQGKASYETAGALDNGRVVWLLSKYDGNLKIGRDNHEQWLLLVNTHDGKHCLSLQWVTVRVVCQNTLSIALATAKNKISIRHTSTWKEQENEARRVLGLTEDYFGALRRELAVLEEKPMAPQCMTEFSKLLFKADDEQAVSTRTANMRGTLNRLFGKGAGNRGETRADAFNAVTDYVDHESSYKGDSGRMGMALLGSGQALKQKAYDYLTADDLMAGLLAKGVAATDARVGAGTFADLLNIGSQVI
jgi:phage/plasmid-like protein (TIGR03299 family)